MHYFSPIPSYVCLPTNNRVRKVRRAPKVRTDRWDHEGLRDPEDLKENLAALANPYVTHAHYTHTDCVMELF